MFGVMEEQIIFPLLSSSTQTIFCGDFNLCSTTKENAIIEAESSYIDVWPAMHQNDSDNEERCGWTQPFRGRFKAWRPDRILLHSTPFHHSPSTHGGTIEGGASSSWLIPLSIVKIGTSTIEHKSSSTKGPSITSADSGHIGSNRHDKRVEGKTTSSPSTVTTTSSTTTTTTTSTKQTWTLPPEVAAMVAAHRAQLSTGYYPSDHFGLLATFSIAP
jgi:hypothetical protein